jgi:ABC-type molybdate transport system substrate-binding protein
MRDFCLAVALALALGSAAQAAELRVLSPGVGTAGGLKEVADAFAQKTGMKVTLVPDGMGKIVEDFKSAMPVDDMVVLPIDLMEALAQDHGIKPGSFTPYGRVEIGLFKKPEAPRPDISTIDKLAVVLKGASQVMYTDPATGSRQALMSGQILKRPEFAGVNGMPIKGDADRFIRNGTGDAKTLGLAIVQSPIPRSGQTPVDPILIGLLPAELGGHMDLAIAISARSENVKDAQSFITFMTSAEAAPLWAAKGTEFH